MSKSRFCNVANVSFNGIRENKILAKISEYTVLLKNLMVQIVGYISNPRVYHIQGILVTQASHYNICYLL